MLFALLAVVGSLAYLPSIAEPRNGKELVFLTAMLAATPFALTDNRWLRFVSVLMVASLCLHPSLPGLNEVILVICALVLLKHCSGARGKYLKKLLVWSGVLLCVLVAVQASGLGPEHYVTMNDKRPYSGYTQCTGDTAAMLAVVAPVALFSGSYGAFSVLLAVLLLMKSVAAAVGLLVAVVVVGSHQIARALDRRGDDKGWLIGYAVMAALLASTAMAMPQVRAEFSEAARDDRWRVWHLALSQTLVSGKWFFGNGIASFMSTFGGLADGVDAKGVLQVKWFAEAHNEYVQLFYEMGVVGLMAGVGAMVSVLRSAWARDKAVFAGLLSGFVVAFGHFTFHLVLCTVPMVILVSLALRPNKEGENA